MKWMVMGRACLQNMCIFETSERHMGVGDNCENICHWVQSGVNTKVGKGGKNFKFNDPICFKKKDTSIFLIILRKIAKTHKVHDK